MAKITKTNKGYEISFNEEEAKALEIEATKKYEIVKVKENLWVMTLEETKKENVFSEDYEIEQKIISMIRTLPPKERMETWFEKKLNEKEKQKFQEMLEQGKIKKFKSSEVFRKALYVLNKDQQNKKKTYENKEKKPEEYSLEKDGFMIVKNETLAKQISDQNKDKIKEGKIRGMRVFTGEYYIIENELLREAENKILKELMKETKQNILSLADKTKLTPTLIRVCAEFLKEEGQILEKKKDNFQYIE
ncbi:MAG: hypothetical protein QXU92_04050 [Candidatus Diapherotrites archaeon]